jgi:hypothetical protein
LTAECLGHLASHLDTLPSITSKFQSNGWATRRPTVQDVLQDLEDFSLDNISVAIKRIEKLHTTTRELHPMERFLEENAQESPWTGLTAHARPAKSDTTTVARSVKYDQALKSTISKHQSPSERLALSLSALGVGSGTFDAFSANTKHSHPIPSLRGSGTMGPSTEKTTRLMGLVVSDDIGSMQALIIRHERVPAGAPQHPRISIRVVTDSVFDAILDAFSKVPQPQDSASSLPRIFIFC